MIPRTLNGLLDEVIRKHKKMAFISGPRQVGKTTLALEYRKTFEQGMLFNWDVIHDQKRLLHDPYFFEKENRDPHKPFLVVLDEIHKYARWKPYLKGAYDRYQEEFQFLITGSGRLELFRRGGESLAGRYLPLPLMPFTVGELLGRFPRWREFLQGLEDPPACRPESTEILERLLRWSGFPEPFVKEDDRFYNAWFQERKSALILGDIRDASNIRQISLLQMLSHALPGRVGAPLSMNSLREDVGVAFETIRDWILLLEQFYYVFRVSPYARSLHRALRKEPKIYLYDWVEVSSAALRYENLVAVHLFKAVSLWRAAGEGDIELHYVRDKERREVDFVLTERGKPVFLVECKTTEEEFAPALLRFQEQLSVPIAIQVVQRSGLCKSIRTRPGTAWIVSADRWLALLP